MKKLTILLFFINILFAQEASYESLTKNKNYVKRTSSLNEIKIETYFFKRDKNLSEKYIKKIKEYISFYEKLIGKYPYKKFTLIESDSPVGYSMPSYTVIGSMIIDKEFVLNRSLAHEILHQWFGESVQVSQNSGNWSEGLVSYLSDYLLSEKKQKGLEYRKDILHQYPLFVNKTNEISLEKFKNRKDRASMLIGYFKGAFIFHMIRKELGDKIFFEKIKSFYKNYAFKKVSIQDICKTFKTKLCPWFKLKGMAHIEIKNLKSLYKNENFIISFEVIQKSENTYPFFLDFKVKTEENIIKKTFFISKKRTPISLKTENKPLSLIVDENLNVFRKLSKREEFKTIADIYTSNKLLVVSEKEKEFKTIKKIFKKAKLTKNPSQKEANENDLLFLEDKLSLAEKFISMPYLGKNEKIFTVKKSPFNKKVSVAFFHYNEAVLRKFSHYLKYSTLIFKKNKIIHKFTNESKNGIYHKISTKSIAVKVQNQKTVKEIVEEIENKKVIFVGENHTNFTNHLNQLKIIKLLHQKGKKIAIGMEMFQRKFQPFIDQYLQEKIDLKTFLKKTQYFKRWKFNFNLYRPIIEYAKNHNIPIVALNLESEITKKVAQKGIFSLSEEEMKRLPKILNFDDEEYESDMKALLSFQHAHTKKTKRMKKEYMFSAQILWDETMAESGADFLKKHPDYTMVILVGNGHIENFYGIPKRLYARVKLPYSVIAQDIIPTPKSADYAIFTSGDFKVSEPIKLGVYLKNEKTLIAEKIVKNSIAEKIGIKKGDLIIKINETKVKELSDLRLELYFIEKNSPFTVTVKRKGKTIKLSFTKL